MKLKEIVECIVDTSVSMTNTSVVGELFDRLCDNLELVNRFNKEINWNRRTISTLLNGGNLPPSLRQSFLLSDFNDMLFDAIHVFYEDKKDKIGEDSCAAKLNVLFSKERAKYPPMKTQLDFGSDFEHALFDCLYQFFWESNEAKRKAKSPRGLTNKSIFATIISTEIQVSQVRGKTVKHTIAYSLDDKMDKNGIEGALREKLGSSFDFYFDEIESTFEFLASGGLDIKYRFLQTMSYYYLNFLESRGISPDDKEKIRSRSADVINYVLAQVMHDVEGKDIEGCFGTEAPIYCFALVAYAFYRCRILIPIEEENNDHRL